MSLTITLHTDGVTADLLTIQVDGLPVEFTLENNQITINTNCWAGMHQLEVQSASNEKIKINEVFFDGCDIRKLIYLSFVKDKNNTQWQPCTELWSTDQTWVLPFAYPLSHWLTLAEGKFKNGVFGSNLHEQYYVWHPIPTVLPDTIPGVIRDFFQHSFDFVAVNHNDPDFVVKAPYMKFKPEIPQPLINNAVTEVHQNLEFIKTHASPYGQSAANIKEFKGLTDENSWKPFWFYRNANASSMQFIVNTFDQFPHIKSLLDYLDLDIWGAFLGVLPAGAFIYPHVDDGSVSQPGYENYQGCTQLYLPLLWPQGNYIKLAGAPALDLHDGPYVINNDTFTHAVVNTSNEIRYVLAVRCHKNILTRCKFV